jgi:hypothetical protein
MAQMNTGNTGTLSPFYTPSPSVTGNSGIGLGNCHQDCFWQLKSQPFHPWEVALTVVAAVVMVAVVVLFVPRLRQA